MSYFTRKQRLKIALGGFLSFVGIAVLIVTFLVATEIIDGDVLQSNFGHVLVGAVVVIGSLDVLGGILLLRSS